MMRITFLLVVFLIMGSVVAQDTTTAFLIYVNDHNIKVISPKKKTKTVSVIVKNNTFDQIVSNISSENKVFERFSVKPQKSTSIEVDYSKIKTMFYVSVAPPFQAVELRFSERPYEIPEKK